ELDRRGGTHGPTHLAAAHWFGEREARPVDLLVEHDLLREVDPGGPDLAIESGPEAREVEVEQATVATPHLRLADDGHRLGKEARRGVRENRAGGDPAPEADT